MYLNEPRAFLEAAYELPGDPTRDVMIIPISGGADSTALAILLHRRFRDVPFRLVFTDTLAEPQSTYEALDRLEAYLGKPIERVMPERGLFELISGQNGFLPGPTSRYCTRLLKLVPFRQWMSQFEGQKKVMFVGIRSDESDRLAFALENVTTAMPFVDMGIRREDVFRILTETVGVPKTYAYRTRSGCSVCPFQSRQELVGLLQFSPTEFATGASCEKVAESDLKRWPAAPPLWKDSGFSENHLSLPMPSATDRIEGKSKRGPDLFGSRMFVGGEFFVDGFPGGEEFVWHQRIVTFSPTLHHLKQQLDDRLQHLLSTSEVFDMSPAEVRRNAKFAIWLVEIPSSVFDPQAARDGGYTWQQGWAYQQLQHVVGWVKRALNAEQLQREANAQVKSDLSVLAEWRDDAKVAVDSIQYEVGSTLLMEWYQPKEEVRELSEEETLSVLPCPFCHI